MSVNAQWEMPVNDTDLAGIRIILEHQFQSLHIERTARRTLVVRKNVHADRSRRLTPMAGDLALRQSRGRDRGDQSKRDYPYCNSHRGSSRSNKYKSLFSDFNQGERARHGPGLGFELSALGGTGSFFPYLSRECGASWGRSFEIP